MSRATNHVSPNPSSSCTTCLNKPATCWIHRRSPVRGGGTSSPYAGHVILERKRTCDVLRAQLIHMSAGSRAGSITNCDVSRPK